MAASARTLQVVVGGVNGYADLAVASNFADGVSTGRLGLYTHANGVIDEGGGGLNARIGKTWSAEGPGVAELGLGDGPSFFGAPYHSLWVANGLAVSQADVDCDFEDPSFLQSFKAFVNAARTTGHLQSVAPIFSPNSSSRYDGSQASLGSGFLDPKWAPIRAAAIYGGGLAFDTPPLFAAYSPPWYIAFVEQEIRWADAMGLRTSVIISPYQSETDFLSQAQTFEHELVAAHAAPTQWVVENYNENANGTYPGDGDFASPIGSEKTANTVAQAADWFARNAPTAVLGAGQSWRIQNPDGSYGDTFTGSSNTLTLTDASAAGKTVYTYAADGMQTGSTFKPAPPKLAQQTPDQFVQAGTALRIVLPAGTFTDAAGQSLAVSARMADGSALPTWLRFDPADDTFAGAAPSAPGVLQVSVGAVAADGQSAGETFRVALVPSAPTFIGPAVHGAAPTQSLGADQAFSLSVDQEAAVHVMRVARQASLAPLPSWISFDAADGVLSGATPAAAGSLSLRIDEMQPGAGMVTETLRLTY